MKEFWMSFLYAIIAGIAGCVGGDYGGKRIIKRQAIEAGVARWTIDPETGAREFEWITNEKENSK
jgi:hypothetical protein